MAIKAILLDLDDTLLLSDMDEFVRRYYLALLRKVRHVCPPEPFQEALNLATHAMWRNDGEGGTNAELFRERFFAQLEREPEELMPLFDDFYRHEFETLGSLTEADPHARPLVELAFARGYQVAIATQPVFPREAILARLRWAGVGADEFPYAAITSYETMSACKPHPRFFQSLLEWLGRKPKECLMVGDTLEVDIPREDLGLKTFWVNRTGAEPPDDIPVDDWGDLRDLITRIKSGRVDDL